MRSVNPEQMSREQLTEQIANVEKGIRQHRNFRGTNTALFRGLQERRALLQAELEWRA